MVIQAIVRATLTEHKMARVGLVGEAKQYKTRLAASAERPFFIDSDNGLSGAVDLLEGKPEPWGLKLTADPMRAPMEWFTTMQVVNGFISGTKLNVGGMEVDPSRYDTLVLDSWTTLGKLLFRYGEYEKEHKPTKGGKDNSWVPYQKYKEQATDLLGKLLSAQNHHVVVTFHLQEKIRQLGTDDKGNPITEEVVRPYQEGQAIENILFAYFDDVFWCERGLVSPGVYGPILYPQKSIGNVELAIGSRHGLGVQRGITFPQLVDLIRRKKDAV